MQTVEDLVETLMGKKPELGIKDPYELNEEQYKAALDLLRGQRALVGRSLLPVLETPEVPLSG